MIPTSARVGGIMARGSVSDPLILNLVYSPITARAMGLILLVRRRWQPGRAS